MNIEKTYKKIIPLDDYQSRRDFSNEDLIDNLTCEEKILIEDLLIEDLKFRYDLLLIETLAYLKSEKAIRIIENILKKSNDPHDNVIIAWSLFSLNHDKNKMIDVAYDNFLEITNDYTKTYLFFYLIRFNDIKINALLESYTDNKSFLLANNSKRALKLKLDNSER
jgi:hypothetical protein